MRTRRHGFFSAGGFEFSPTLTGNVPDYNVSTAATAVGWDGIKPLIATITIATGAVVYGTLTTAGAAAFTVPSLPTGSIVNIIRNGSIIGRGGASGAGGGGTPGSAVGQAGGTGYDGLLLSYPVTLYGTGMIAGGGGSGGGGQGITIDSPNGQYSSAGGGGGNGAGTGGSLTGDSGGSGIRTGDATYFATGGTGGTGGGPGMMGGSGTAGTGTGTVNSTRAPGAGGAPGRAIVNAEFVTLNGDVFGDVRGAVTFTTISYIATPTATPVAGAALDGGYYAGFSRWAMVDTETASVSRTPSYGPLSLFFAGMKGNPKVYGGQTIWLRSASNPTSFMSGTVTGASGGIVSVNIISIGGTTANDWVLTAVHRVVVAPKATGETTLQVLSSAVTMPLNTYTVIEAGLAQTALLTAAGSAVALASAWAAGLNIGGKTDWKVPTREMQEAAYRGLKAQVANNYSTADRDNTPLNTYTRCGALDNTSNRHGFVSIDPTFTIPANNIYIADTPAQISAAQAQFRTGGTEAFDWGTGVQYLTSTAYDASNIWAQSYDPASAGRQIVVSQTTSGKIRAMRLSII